MMKALQVKCTRCRFKHQHSERVDRPRPRRSTSEIPVSDSCCPRCGCKSFYDMSPQIAWCWASGLIEIGDAPPADNAEGGGPIVIAEGPQSFLKSYLGVVARHGKGENSGKLLVPGVPEATDQKHAADALGAWLDWCAKSRAARRQGIVFSRMTS